MKLLSFLLVICFSILPLLFSATIIIFNPSPYPPLFEKHGVAHKFAEQGVVFHEGLLAYLRGANELPTNLPLDSREQEHMKDVKKVATDGIRLVEILYVAAVLLTFFSIRLGRDPTRALGFGGAISFVVTSCIALASVLNFDAFFAFFHSLFFKSGTWIFPSSGTLVSIYPEGLFFDLGLQILMLTLLISLGMAFAGKVYIKRLFKKRT